MAENATVKVYKEAPDTVTFYMGAAVQVNEEGREFFELAPGLEEIAVTYTNLVWPK